MDTPLLELSIVGGRGGDDLADVRARRNERCPTGKMGDAWDVAHASLFLAGDESRYITGHCLVVDGGLTCVAGWPVSFGVPAPSHSRFPLLA